MSTSAVQWNGSNVTTTFVSNTQLTAAIPATAIATPYTVGQVTVFNPSPGGGVSNALPFNIVSGAAVIARVSVASDGTQANGKSFQPAISANGRFIAFASDAINLVPNDTNGVTDIFLYDTCNGVTPCTPSTVRVSVASDGTQANGASTAPAISADGRFIAFTSEASNLVPNDTNGLADIFVRDTCIGATGCTPSTVRVSVASDGTQGNGKSFDVFGSMSADGRFIAFTSLATNLVPGGTNGLQNIFVRDTCAGATGCTPSTTRVSVPSSGTQTDTDSTDPWISANGRFVAFLSAATNLVPGPTNGFNHVFVRDTCLGATGCTPSTTRVSVASGGALGNNNTFEPSISGDGRFVAFASVASNLVPNDTNGAADAFVRDTCFGATGCTPSTTRVSVATDGTQGNADSLEATISANGRFVSFLSVANNLVPNKTTGVQDVFVRDTCFGASGCTPATVRVSVTSGGIEANGDSTDISISSDGRFVVFPSGSNNLVPNDTNGVADIFLARTGF